MRITFWLLLLLIVSSCGEAATAQDKSIEELRRIFDYDRHAPLDVREAGVINREGVRLHDKA